MKADLVSNLLDFDDLAGFIGGKPEQLRARPLQRSKKSKLPQKRKAIDYFLINVTTSSV